MTKRCIVEINRSMLATLLNLPADAEIEDCQLQFFEPATVLFRVVGMGYETQHGDVLRTVQGFIDNDLLPNWDHIK